MAFTSAVTQKTVFGNKRVHIGTYTNGSGDTGGDIETGLNKVEACVLIPTGSSVQTNAPVANETFPLESGDVTIVTDDNADGAWVAIGN